MEIYIQKGVFPQAELTNHHRYNRDQLANFYNKYINKFVNFEQETCGSVQKKKTSKEINKELVKLDIENIEYFKKHGKNLEDLEERRHEILNG